MPNLSALNLRIVWLIGLFLLLSLDAAMAQQPKKIARIGFLGNSTPKLEANLVGPFREGIARSGLH